MKRESQIAEFVKAASTMTDFQKEQAKKKYEEFRGRRGNEKKLWEQWHEGGRKPEDLQPLIKSFEPLINSETKKRLQGLGGAIPQSALKNELRGAAVKAFQSYKPERGTQLSTHVVTNFQRVTDFIAAGRNQLYMPRPDIEQHQRFMGARDQFMEEHGREPTPAELQQHLPGMSVKRIRRLAKGFSPEVFSEMGENLDESMPKVDVRDAFLMARPTLTEHQRQFGELHYPAPGEKQMSVSAISKQMKLPQHRVYQIKSEVERRLGGILKKE